MSSRVRTSPGAGAITGPPAAVLSGLPEVSRLDELLSEAAQRSPDETALRTSRGMLTYGELTGRVSAFAGALRALAGGPGAVVAVTAELGSAFPVAYFGVSRASGVSVVLDPLLPDGRLVHALRVSRATVAVVTPDMHCRLLAARDRLPDLAELVVTRRDAAYSPPDAPTVGELVRQGPPHTAGSGDERSADEPASLQFTGGTTGGPKAARLTHRNLTVNAAQTAYGTRLTGSSVLFHHLPALQPGLLAASVAAGAALVLHEGEDPAEAVRAARRCGATHFHSLPARLARLAADARLPRLRAPDLRAIVSGGSALSERTAATLAGRFRVPVVQGYGLAETAQATHLDDLAHPRPGSAGVPLPGTQCRIADLVTGAAQLPGARGEIQVRGPQLMRGYLDRKDSGIGPDGWFATGDLGYVDAEGRLFVVGRIGDAFICDDRMVMPTEIERVLSGHPAVDDCVVLDRPEPSRGAVPCALVVASDAVEPGDLVAHANAQLPYYGRLHDVKLVPGIPRSPTGGAPRRELRRWLLALPR
ncbi:class I adenylate-forming enzyme family protein [Streptomyces armeniacus]|nr:class I adenylate-forming enzyme family protein [Streptomyces armeniacus]AZY91996.1 hypothetical protein [Streptomyces armeniacus]